MVSSESSEEDNYNNCKSSALLDPSLAENDTKAGVPPLRLNHSFTSPAPNQLLAEWASDNMCYGAGNIKTAFQFNKVIIVSGLSIQ